MSSGNTSEEKTLPPSTKKLRDLRKKGQIPRSPEMVGGLSAALASLYLMMTASRFSNDFKETVRVIFALQDTSFDLAAAKAAHTLALFLGYHLIFLLLLVVSVAIVANIIINKGVLFSVEPMKPDFNKLNPVEGFKRIFSMRTAVDLAKHIVKIGLLLVLCLTALTNGLQAALSVPFCGATCLGPAASQIALPIIIIAISIWILGGTIDLFVQRWLFLRDQRMTKTEVKRERKDEEGSPEIRMTQTRLRRGFLQRFAKYNGEDATIFIEGFSTAIGLRFVRNETPLPLIVCKGKGNQASELLNAAQVQRTPVHFDDEFAVALSRRAEIGSTLGEAFFDPFIKALKATKQI